MYRYLADVEDGSTLFNKRGKTFHQNHLSWENYHQGTTVLDEIGIYRGFHSEGQNTFGNWQLSWRGMVYFNKTHHMQCINKCKMGNK